MNTYVLFLRGVNVGKSVRVSMPVLRKALENIGGLRVASYINSGNLLFDSEEPASVWQEKVKKLLSEHFAEGIRFVIVNGSDLIREAEELPHWWIENPARRDVLFYTEEADPGMMKERIERMPLHQEIVHFGKMAVFWGKLDEAEFLKSAYHKLLIKEAFYPLITIRNGNTFDKMVRLCRERVSETV
jgi:uncharacterized protein (DUF1697 family)